MTCQSRVTYLETYIFPLVQALNIKTTINNCDNMDGLWGLRTSLYSTLTAAETEVLEELCAGYRGSLALALNIFETRLPSAESVSILVIEKANLLASIGREIDCAALCRAVLDQIESLLSPAVFYCISLREGLSELYISGRLIRALEKARVFEIWFKDTVLEQYSDIHVSSIASLLSSY